MSNQETLEHILHLLDDEEGISFKRMFGGYGVFKNELAVALILRSEIFMKVDQSNINDCLLYTSPSPRDGLLSRMPSSA